MNDPALRRMLAEQSPWRTKPAGWEQDDAPTCARHCLPLDYEPEPLADIRPPGLWHVVTGDALRTTTMSETEVAVQRLDHRDRRRSP